MDSNLLHPSDGTVCEECEMLALRYERGSELSHDREKVADVDILCDTNFPPLRIHT